MQKFHLKHKLANNCSLGIFSDFYHIKSGNKWSYVLWVVVVSYIYVFKRLNIYRNGIACEWANSLNYNNIKICNSSENHNLRKLIQLPWKSEVFWYPDRLLEDLFLQRICGLASVIAESYYLFPFFVPSICPNISLTFDGRFINIFPSYQWSQCIIFNWNLIFNFKLNFFKYTYKYQALFHVSPVNICPNEGS